VTTLNLYRAWSIAVIGAIRLGLDRRTDITALPREKQVTLDTVRGLIGSCSCDDAYVRRQMSAPDCAWCNYGDDLVEAMQNYADKAVEAAFAKLEQDMDDAIGGSTSVHVARKWRSP